jgi:Rrf2 family protein
MLSREIAEELGIPPPFLAKVLQVLATTGILDSQRGRGGGFRLARDPESLSLYEIVEPFDHLGDRKICVLGQKVCSEEAACPLHNAWKATRGLFLSALQGTTLASVERMNVPGGFPRRFVPATSGAAVSQRR